MNSSAQIPIFYINMNTRADRRGFMEEQFKRLGISAQRVEAVSSEEVPHETMLPHLDRDNPWAISKVEVACLLSHIAAWTRFLDQRHPAALILEDDVILGDALPAFLAPGLTDALAADVLKLETFNKHVRVGRGVGRAGGRFIVRTLLSTHMGTAAYIITADMARRCLRDPALGRMAIDRYLFERAGPLAGSRSIFQVDPAPAIQLKHFEGSKEDSVARSDLTPHRLAWRQRASHSWLFRWRSLSAKISQQSRATWHMLRDPEARQSRRRIAFDPHP